MSTAPNRKWIVRSLLAIILLAAAVRVWGSFGQGYPRCYYGDEYTNIERVLRFGAQQSPDPGSWLNKPALGFYVILVEYGAYYGIGKVAGLWENPYEFGVSYFRGQGPFLLIGRLSTALFGVLTVLLVYRLGKSLFDVRTGMVGALALALTLGHVASSQQVKMDVPSAFWNTWCMILIVGIMRRGRFRDYVFAGLLAGLGMATKYYSLIMILPMGLAHLLREPAALARSPRVWLSPRFLASGAALFAGFFIGSPYNTLNGWWQGRFFELLSWALSRFGITLGEAGPRGPLVTESHTLWDSFWVLLQNMWSAQGAGPVISALAGLGCVVCCIRRGRGEILLLLTAFVMLSGIAIANRQLPLPRHLAILYPILATLAGVGVHGACSLLPRLSGLATGAVVLTCLVPVAPCPLGEVILENQRRLMPDPRNRVLDWIAANVPDGSVVINDHERAALMPDRFRCAWVVHRLKALRGRSEGALERLSQVPDGEKRDRDIAWHRRRIGVIDDQLTKWQFRTRASAGFDGPRYDAIVFDHVWQTEKLAERPYAHAAYNPTWPHSPWGERFDQIVHQLLQAEKPVNRGAVIGEYLGWLRGAYLRIASAKVTDAARRKGLVLTLDQLEAKTEERLRSEWEEMGGRWPDTPPSIVELWRRDSPVSRPWLTWQEEGPQVVHRPVEFFISTKKSFANYAPDKDKKRRSFFDWAALYDDLERNYDSWDFNLEDDDESRIIRIWDLRQRKSGAATRTRVW